LARLAGVRTQARRKEGYRGGTGWFLPFFALLALPPIAIGFAALLALRQAIPVVGPDGNLGGRSVDLSSLGAGRLDSGLPQSAVIRARDGTVLAEVQDHNYGRRNSVSLDNVSSNMIAATLAAEDRRFFQHSGVDLAGMARAALQTAESEDSPSGGSTIEMQLARNLFLSDERNEQTLSRKLRETAAAMELDRHFAKKDILEAYLNIVYYGAMAHGVEAAAETYFGKPARELTLAESSLLAGLPQSPTVLNPFENMEAARERQRYVLDQMVLGRAITEDEADEAWNTALKLTSPVAASGLAPHWVNYVEDYVRQKWGPEGLYLQGLDIKTSIDLDIQGMAEQIVTANEPIRRQAAANNTAMVVLDRQTSQVLAMVGSKDFNNRAIDGQVNVALAGRQPGSSIKPLVYLTAFERGLYPGVQVTDEITPFSAPPGQPPYVPANYEDKYYGLVTLRDALGNSLNVPAVKVLKWEGVPALKDMARRLGVTSLENWDPRWLSLTLGGGEVSLLELTGAYATISREGEHKAIEPIVDVQDGRGNEVYQAPAGPGPQVVDPRVAYQLLNVMGDSGARMVTFGAASPLNLPRPHMVKTGTTDDFRDTWTVGCLPQVCVGVWMGNTQNMPMVKTSSSLTAGKVWVDMMNALISRYGWTPDAFPVPEGVEFRQIRNVSGARPGVSDYQEVFLPGQQEGARLQMNWMQPDQ
jgi:penicillin-binding protein 1C